MPEEYQLKVIGWIESDLTQVEKAPPQGAGSGQEAWLILEPQYAEGLDGIQAGDHLLVLTWLHLAERWPLKLPPHGNHQLPSRGVFATRSPHRPNPIGVHLVEVLAVEGNRLRLCDMEAVDGTPVVDIKIALRSSPSG
jgi:tRNA-Thr(GGU) m(6)t(6)A37 methyltransferase TsaA